MLGYLSGVMNLLHSTMMPHCYHVVVALVLWYYGVRKTNMVRVTNVTLLGTSRGGLRVG